MRLPHPIALFLLCAVALPLACGCEDSQARRRAEVQQIINTATVQLDETTAIRVDPDRESQVRQQLNRLITNLADTADGVPGQQAAASRLAANAHRTLASIDLVQADRLEADHRARRGVVDGMIDAALELDAVASAQEAIDTSAQQESLAEDSDATGVQLGEFGQIVATLDGPIAELKRRNRDDRAQVDRLREEASQLRREAADMGPGAGYSTFEHSLQLDRQADGIEYEIAQRDVELRFLLEPEHGVAQSRIEQARNRIQTDDSARKSLEDATEAMYEEASATRTSIAELGERIAEALSEIEQSSAGALADLYDRAGSNLERAASKARSAATMARGEGTDAARVEATQAFQQLGDMYRAKARGLEQDIALRQRLADHADIVVGIAGVDTSLAGLRAAHEESTGKAIAAYTSAQEVLGQVSGRAARRRLETLKANVSLLQAAPSGGAVDHTGVAGESPAPTERRSPAPAPGRGAESPQALVEALGSVTDLASFTDIQHNLTHIELTTPVARQIYDASVAAGRALAGLDKAMQDQLGGGLGTPAVSLGEVSGDRAAMTVTMFGQPQEQGLIRINGLWYINATEQLNAQIAQVEAMGLDQAAMLGLVEAQGAAIVEVTQRVRAGEFSSVQDAMMALGQAMQGAQ